MLGGGGVTRAVITVATTLGAGCSSAAVIFQKGGDPVGSFLIGVIVAAYWLMGISEDVWR